jgi:lipooligosaccharide transport system permease protein
MTATEIAVTGTDAGSCLATTGGWRAVAEHWLRKYRRIWLGSAFSSFLTPLFFLGGIGFGLGMLVDRGTGGIGGVPYVAFVAPGVFAATAMQIGVGECSYSVMGGIKWNRMYHGMLATPLRVRDVVTGQLVYVLLRVVSATAVFLVIAALFGVVRSWWAVLAVPVASFAGLAFAACVFAFSARLEVDRGLTMMFRFVVTPMSLFAGTYFPLEQLPGWLRPVAWVTPWWHAVDAVRGLFLGTATPGMVLGHLAYLAVWFVAGYLLAVAALRRRMVV